MIQFRFLVILFFSLLIKPSIENAFMNYKYESYDLMIWMPKTVNRSDFLMCYQEILVIYILLLILSIALII